MKNLLIQLKLRIWDIEFIILFLISVAAAHFIMMIAESEPFLASVFDDGYLLRLSKHLVIALIVVSMVNKASSYLDKRLPQQDDEGLIVRLGMQMIFGVGVVAIVAIFLSAICYKLSGINIVETRFFEIEVWFIVMIIIILNFYYSIIHVPVLSFFKNITRKTIDEKTEDNNMFIGNVVEREGANIEEAVIVEETIEEETVIENKVTEVAEVEEEAIEEILPPVKCLEGSGLIYIEQKDIAIVYRHELYYIKTFEGKEYQIDQTLYDIYESLNRTMFFRVHKCHIVNHAAVIDHENIIYERLRLKLIVNIFKDKEEQEIIVSRKSKVKFLIWLKDPMTENLENLALT